MKRAVLVMTALLFALNSFVSVALADDCGMEMQAAAQTNVEHSEMPCHNMGEQKPAEKETAPHCDGLCLCLHMGVNQVPLMPFEQTYNVSYSSADIVEFGQAPYSSHITSPDLRPPIPLS